MDSVIAALRTEAQGRIESLTAKRWNLPGDHPLAALHGAALDGHQLLVLLGPKSSVGSQSFQLLIADTAGRLAEPPLAFGLFNRGPYPAFNWIELTRYDAVLSFDGTALDLVSAALDLTFFELLSALVPAGGHIMVEYDSPTQRRTERMLTLGYPPAVTPLGFLLFQVGCRSYKNWHISEGWREGPRKIQGFKPWNKEIEREKTEYLRVEVSAVTAAAGTHSESEWAPLAVRNAESILETLRTYKS
jgi:hypothetical protein